MTRLLRAVLVALVVIGSLAAPATAVGPASAPGDQELLASLGSAEIARHPETGRVRYIGPQPGRPIARAAGLAANAAPERAARGFLARYGQLFGVKDAARGLKVAKTASADRGRAFVRYQQVHGDVPVLGGELVVQVDAAGNVLSANGEALPDLTVGTTPAIPATAARDAALTAIAKYRKVDLAELSASAPELWIYDPALLGGPGARISRLVWRLDVTSDRATPMRELVLVDAVRGTIALHFDQLPHAKNRRVCDANNQPQDVPCTQPDLTETAPPTATAATDAARAFHFAGDTYDFFYKRFGRDSIDGKGMAIVSTVEYCPEVSIECPYQNAYWDGTQMVFGEVYAQADDIVGHELAHGVTEHTSKLFYYYQSGAINESLSDVFGELMDQSNPTRTDEGYSELWEVGDSRVGVLRRMDDPTAEPYIHPDKMTSFYYTDDADEEDGGGVHKNSGVNNKAAYLMVEGSGAEDYGMFNGQTITGIGLDKTAAIYYRAAAFHLRSASDYADLYNALRQSCTDLTGTTPKDAAGNPNPLGAITAANCEQVRRVVVATEMHLQPTNPGTAPREAAVCGSGQKPWNAFYDDLENPASGNWAKGPVTLTRNLWSYPQNPNPYTSQGFDATYATSGKTNMWGDDYANPNDPSTVNRNNRSDSAIRMTKPIAVPANAFFHFRHAYGFDDFQGGTLDERYDGGVVEYSTNGGTSWVDAGSLFTSNGYNGTLFVDLEPEYRNPLAGRKAFTGESAGYGSSRMNLSSLAGKNVLFRFRIGTDGSYADYGWFIDDVRLYTCGAATDTTPPIVTAPKPAFITNSTVGTTSTPIPVRISWTATDAASQIAKTRLERKVDAGSYAAVTLPTANATSVTQSFAPSTTTKYTYRDLARDTAGNVNPSYATGTPFEVNSVQQTSSGITYSTGWSSASLSSYYGGSVKYASSAGRTATYKFTGTSVAVVSTKAASRGNMQVTVDGVSTTVNLYRSTTAYRQVVYSKTNLSPTAQHTVTVKVLGTKDSRSSSTRVDLDAFLVITP